MAIPSTLRSVVSQPSNSEVPPAIQALVDHLCQQYDTSIQGILFYGSCLRTKTDQDGLVDLYVLVNNNRATAPNLVLAALNKLIPPRTRFGAITQGSQACRKNEQKIGRLGRLGEGWILAKFLFGLITGQRRYIKPIPITITSNGEVAKETEHLTFFATTLERLFFGLRPFWGTEPHSIHYTALNGSPKHLL